MTTSELQRAYPSLTIAKAAKKYSKRVIVAAAALADTYNRLQMKALRQASANIECGIDEQDKNDSLSKELVQCWQMRLCLVDNAHSRIETNEGEDDLFVIEYARYNSS